MRVFVRVLIAMMVGCVGLLGASSSAFAQSDCNPNPSDFQKSQALESMAAGVAFLQDPEGAKHEDAYPQFKKAYELSCSVNALQNLALCEMNLELDGDAIAHYAIVLEKKADLAETDRRQIESDLARLKASVAWIDFSAERPGVTLLDERKPRSGNAVRNTYKIGVKPTKLGIHPGSHTFTATDADGKKSTWTAEVKAGAQLTHEFKFTDVGPGPGPGPGPIVIDDEDDDGIPITVWIAGGGTLASAAVMGVFMGLSTAKKSEFDDELAGKASVDEQQSAVDDIQTFCFLGDIFMGVTIAGAATTAVLLVMHLTGDDDEDAGDGSNKEGPKFGVDYTVAPLVVENGGGAALTVQF